MNGEAYPERMSHGTTREPMASRVNELADRVSAPDRPSTMLESHANQLVQLEDGLERALLQYENLLGRLAGPRPTQQGDNKASNPESMSGRLSNSQDRLHSLCSRLNDIADELNHLI